MHHNPHFSLLLLNGRYEPAHSHLSEVSKFAFSLPPEHVPSCGIPTLPTDPSIHPFLPLPLPLFLKHSHRPTSKLLHLAPHFLHFSRLLRACDLRGLSTVTNDAFDAGPAWSHTDRWMVRRGGFPFIIPTTPGGGRRRPIRVYVFPVWYDVL